MLYIFSFTIFLFNEVGLLKEEQKSLPSRFLFKKVERGSK